MAAAEPATLCRALQENEAADGLGEVLAARGTANKFFSEYFSGAEWTCADAEDPPSGLAECLTDVPESVIEVLLLKVVQLAASESDVGCSRAIGLVNAMWDRAGPVLPQSCAALREAVATQLGADMRTADDASGGNEEMLRMTWANLLSFMSYEREDFERAQEALARCGPSA